MSQSKAKSVLLSALCIGAAGTALLGPGRAAAAEAEGNRPVEAAAPGGGDIVVTARRREENSQDVPISLSVLSGAALAEKGALHIQQLYQEVPSLNVYTVNPRNVTVNIRGLGTNVAFANVGLDLGVGFYVDDVYYARINPAVFNLVDIDRVEILRGPQGTLFGRNTTAGALSVATRKPSFTPEGSIEVSGGNYGYLQARALVSGPLVPDRLAARLSLEATDRGGFLRNVEQDNRAHDFKNLTARGQLLFTPSDALSVRLIADYAKNSQRCCASLPLGYITTYDNGAPIAFPFLERMAQFGYTPLPVDPKARLTDTERMRSFRSNQGGVSAQVDWDLGENAFTSITAFRFWNSHPKNDLDQTAVEVSLEAGQDDRQRQWSQEFRLASVGERTVDYVLGLYFFQQSYAATGRNENGAGAGLYFIAPGTAGLTPDQRSAALAGSYTIAPSVAKTRSYAAFGQATWHITEGLSLTGGLRFTYERKNGHFEQVRGSRVDISGLTAAQIALRNAFTPVVPYYALKKDWSSLSGMVTLSQQFAPDALVYATYSRGAKSGGLNFANLPRDAGGELLTELAVVAPEKVNNYEIGFKTQWFDRRLTANVSLFRTDISGYQSSIQEADVIPVRNYIGNVGSVRSQGVEVELRARPVSGLNFYASGSYNPVKYRSYRNAACPYELTAPGQPLTCDLSGRQIPAAPRYSASAGGDFTVPLDDRLSLFGGADYSYRSSYYTTYNLSRYSRLDGQEIVNARIGVKGDDGRWEASIWGRNIFDALTFSGKQVDFLPGGRLIGFVGDPRTWGGTLRYNF